MIGRLRTDHGFTLVEKMIVVAIIGILVAVAIPNYLTWNNRQRLKAAVEDVRGQLVMARMNALNQNVAITTTVGQASPVTVTVTNPTGGAILPTTTLPTDVSLTDAQGTLVGTRIEDVQFNSKGLRVNTGRATNRCIASTGAYINCGATTRQAFNFRNNQGDNFRLVVNAAGKIASGAAGISGVDSDGDGIDDAMDPDDDNDGTADGGDDDDDGDGIPDNQDD